MDTTPLTKTVSAPMAVLVCIVFAIAAFIRYVRMQYWLAHHNFPFAVLNGVTLLFLALVILVMLGRISAALRRHTESVENASRPVVRLCETILFEKIPSPIVALLGGILLLVGLFYMLLYVSCMFCIVFDSSVVVAAVGYYILKRKFSVPGF